MNKDDIQQLVKSGIRSIAATVPFAASLAQAWTEYETVAQSKRIGQFFVELELQMAKSAERIKAVENHIATSGEIPTLVERTVENVRRENDATKRKAFAGALTNIVCEGPNMAYDDKITFIETLDVLTTEDIRILAEFDKSASLPGEHFFSPVRWVQTGTPPLATLNDSRMVGSLSKLQSRGLIGESSDTGHLRSSSGDAKHWLNQWRSKSFDLLPMGKLFCKILREKN